MTSLFPSQRAAEDFDSVVEGLASPAVADRYADLFATVVTLRTQPEVLPRAEFASDLRSRLMTEAATVLVPAAPVVRRLEPSRAHKRNRRIGTLAAGLVIVGGTAGMAAAAQGSLPGDALYPVKRGIEQASVAVHPSDAGKGAALLDQARTRLAEVKALQGQDSPDAALIASTLESFRSAADAGSDKLFTAYQAEGDTSDISTVRGFTSDQMAQVADLSDASIPVDSDQLVDTADLLADIDQQARVLCAACAPQAPLQPPAALSSGAGAASVDNLLARPVSQVRADVARAQAARIARLQAAAERSAQAVAQVERENRAAASAPAQATDPVTNTVTPDGRLVPSVTTAGKTAVKDLVSGVTGTVTTVTQGVTTNKTPLDPVVKGLTDTVDGLTEQLLPTPDH
jgi:plasmid stabilization system protein ParE